MVNLDDVYIDNEDGLYLFTVIDCKEDNILDVMKFIAPHTLSAHTLTTDDIQHHLGDKKDIGKNGIIFVDDMWRVFVPFGAYIGRSFAEFDGSTSRNNDDVIWRIDDLSECLTVKMYIDNLIELVNKSLGGNS